MTRRHIRRRRWEERPRIQPPQPPDTDSAPSPASEPQPDPGRQRQPAAPGAPTAMPGRSPRHRRLAWVVPSVVAILLVAVLAHLVLGVPLPLGVSVPLPVPADWQTYHDPAGLFSIRVPPGWTIRMDSGSATVGDRTG